MASSRLKRSNASSRKARERRARRQEIMAAARVLFTRNGFHGTTLEEVAFHAGFGKGTIYNYFSSKEDLLSGIIDQIIQDTLTLAQTVTRAAGAGARRQLAAYAEAMIAHARDNADLFNLIMREVTHLDTATSGDTLAELSRRGKKIRELLTPPLAKEIRKGTIRFADPHWLAATFDGMVREYCMMQFGAFRHLASERINAEEAGEKIVAVFFDGVAQRKRKV